jgi:CO/xanthine dehydrogenase FAD-binding subunit
MYGDRFAPEEYRRHLAGVVVERALESARERLERR